MQATGLLTLSLCLVGLTFANHSPVFLWNAKSVEKPSLKKVSSVEFGKLVTLPLTERPLIVFMEDELSTKDFLCTNTDDGSSCFARLQGVSDKTYYAAVENPVESLRNIGEHEYNSVDSFGKLSKPLELKPGKINLLKFVDKSKSLTRKSRLQSHDSIISKITSEIGDKAFYMYASAPSTDIELKRKRRQTSEDSQGYVVRADADLLLYFKSLRIIEGTTTTVFEIAKDLCLPSTNCVKVHNTTALSVKLTPKSGAPLTFDITYAGGYFFMQNVIYDNYTFLTSEVNAPTDFSYFCGNLTLNNIRADTDKTPSVIMQWNYLQFQAPFGYTKNTSFAFSDPWHCVGFFSGGILSGLLIVALLLTITFTGICWMMDINTMDRFDDAKGKTITISATE